MESSLGINEIWNQISKLSWMWQSHPTLWPEFSPTGQKWPKLSIITPSYNQGNFLEETIRSVLYQGYPNLEYIIIDGGSSDNSIEIIKKYEHQIAYWVSEKDRGQSHAVNKGLEVATGDYVGWINSDDVYTKRCFSDVMRAFISSPELCLVYGSRILINEHTRVTGWVPGQPFDPQTTGFNIASETAFWNRKIHDCLLTESLQFAMDLDLFIRIHQSAPSRKLEQFLGCFRCYGNNKSSTIQHIGRIESERLWLEYYPSIPDGWKNKQKISQTHLLSSLLRNFSSFGFRYLVQRLLCKK